MPTFLNVSVTSSSVFVGVEGKVKVALEHVSKVSGILQSPF